MLYTNGSDLCRSQTTFAVVKECQCKQILSQFDTYSRDESLGPLAIVHGVGGDQAHFALRHQLSLRRRGRFHQGTGGRCDGLGRLQDLLLEVQRLVRLLRRERGAAS